MESKNRRAVIGAVGGLIGGGVIGAAVTDHNQDEQQKVVREYGTTGDPQVNGFQFSAIHRFSNEKYRDIRTVVLPSQKKAQITSAYLEIVEASNPEASVSLLMPQKGMTQVIQNILTTSSAKRVEHSEEKPLPANKNTLDRDLDTQFALKINDEPPFAYKVKVQVSGRIVPVNF